MPVGESKHLLSEKLVASYAQTRNQKKKKLEKKCVQIKKMDWEKKSKPK